jgi:hypothetical protein
MSNTTQLRLNGYSVNSAGHIECAKGAPEHSYQSKDPSSLRFEQEHVAVIKIDGPRELAEQLIVAADSPRALTGRGRGGAVLLFRREKGQCIKPSGPTYRGLDVFELMRTDTRERITLTIKSEGMSIDFGAYSWPKGRSPLEISRDSLPILTFDLSDIAVEAAFKIGCTWAPTEAELEREREREASDAQFRADVASGKIKLKTEAEIAAEDEARSDEATVAAWKDKDVVASDGNGAMLIIAARMRHFWRRKKQTDAA